MLAPTFSVSCIDGGSDVDIVMLPGLFAGGWIWEGVIRMVASTGRCRFLVFDEPIASVDCLGRSEVAHVADRVLGALDDAGARRSAVLCGNSFGALVALDVAVRLPDRVSAIAVSGMPGLGPEVRLELGERTDKEDFVSSLGAKLFTDVRCLTPQRIDDAYQLFRDLGTLRNILRATRASRVYPSLQALGRLDRPLLMVWGDGDEVTPLGPAAQAVAAGPGRRLRVVAGAGHSPMLERPTAFAEHLVTFLGDHGLLPAPGARQSHLTEGWM